MGNFRILGCFQCGDDDRGRADVQTNRWLMQLLISIMTKTYVSGAADRSSCPEH